MPRKSSHGFTLMEVMIAMLVLGIGLGTSVLAMCNAMQWVRLNRMREFALHANREALETARCTPFSAFATNSHAVLPSRASCDTTFTMERSAILLSTPPAKPVYEVTTTAVWMNPFRPQEMMTNRMTTVISQVMQR